MLWLLLLATLGGLLYVMFHKPSVNAAGAGWTPPPPTPVRPVSPLDTVETGGAPVEPPVPMSFNDLYAAPRADSQHQPRA